MFRFKIKKLNTLNFQKKKKTNFHKPTKLLEIFRIINNYKYKYYSLIIRSKK